MSDAFLEHVNVTVSDPDKTAQRLVDLFGWHIRWKGEARNGGTTIHVGSDASYIAVYSLGTPAGTKEDSYGTKGALNHIGIVVDDIDATEARIKKAGYHTHNHGDYEPGRRFYFDEDDGIEIEVVSYPNTA